MPSRLTFSFRACLTLTAVALLSGSQALALPGDDQGTTRSTLSKVFAFPKACASVLCGVTVGVPVSIAHDISVQTKHMQGIIERDLTDGQPTAYERVIASSMSVPYGVLSGLIQGSIQGTQRAVEYGYKEPFSKESMSLEEPK